MLRRMVVITLLITASLSSSGITRPTLAQRKAAAGGNLFLPPPRTLRLHLTRAQRAIAEKRFSDAVQELGTLLAGANADPELRRLAKQDYFVKPKGQASTLLSLKAQAQNLLENMSAKGRELYELNFGAEARSLLKKAIASGNIDQLQDVTRRYFHTKAGYEAAMLLGRLQLSQGRTLAASMSFGRLVRSKHGRARFEPQLSFLLATCQAISNQSQKAHQTLINLKQRLPNARLAIGGEKVGLFQNDKDSLKWLRRQLGELKEYGINLTEHWVVFRGGPARNAKSAGDLPLSRKRWELPTSNDPSDEAQVKKLYDQNRENNLALLPALHPLAVNDLVLMRTARRLVAVDLSTGKRLWEYPWFESREEKRLRESRTRLNTSGTSPRRQELRQRLWDDIPYGQLSSDGKSVFVIEGLGYIDNSNPYRRIVFRGGRMGTNPGMSRNFNRLVSLDLKKEGKLRWMIGGPKGDDESRLAGAFFLGSPLPMMDRLYAMVEVNGEIRLVVINSETGLLEWAQQLAHVDSRTILADSRRRLAGATPSFADGVMICPTSAGAVVAVDVVNRSLLWGFQYYQAPVNRRRVFISRSRNTATERDAKWADATATISNGKVILTPFENDKVYCLDLMTGKKLWEKSRSDKLFLACIHNGAAVFAGKKTISAFKLSDGTSAWENDIKLGRSYPSGRGFYSGSDYFLPTASSELLKIDLTAGKISRRIKTSEVLGNLICHGDELVSHNVLKISSYYQIEPLRRTVQKQLVNKPNDGVTLTLKGQLLLHDGDKTKALETLRRAYKLMPEDDETRELLVKTLLGALEEDFTANQAYAAELEKLIDQPEQRNRYLRLTAQGLHKQKKYAQAFRYYLDLADMDAKTRRFDAKDALEDIGSDLRVRSSRWIQAQLRDLFAKATPEERITIGKEVKSRAEAAAAGSNVTRMKRLLEYFDGLEVTDRVRLSVARKLISAKQFIEAERELSSLMHSSPAIRGPTVAQLATLYRAANDNRQAAYFYNLLKTTYANTKCQDDLTGAQLAAAAYKQHPVLASLSSGRIWAFGQVESNRKVVRNSASYKQYFPIRITEVSGHVDEHVYPFYDHQMSSVSLRNARGRILANVPVARSDGHKLYTNNYEILHGKQHGNILVLSLGFEYIAIDLLKVKSSPRESVLWRRDFNMTVINSQSNYTPVRTRTNTTLWGFNRTFAVSSIRSRHGIGFIGPVTDRGTIIQRNTNLMCVDTVSGEILWSRNNVAVGTQVFGDHETVVLHAPRQNQARLIRTADGKQIGQASWNTSETFWTSYGRRALVYKSVEGKRVARLWDVVTGKTIWAEEFPLHSRATRVGDDEVIWVERGGRTVVRSLVDPQRRLQMKLPTQLSLVSIHALRSKDQYIIATNGPAPVDRENNYNGITNYNHAPVINGQIHAFDTRNGKMTWHSPVLIEQFAFPLDQPMDAPVLTLFRHHTRMKDRPRTQKLSVLCLDRRDGTIAAHRAKMNYIRNYHIEADVRKSLYRIKLPHSTIDVKLTAEVRPPSAPADVPIGGVRRNPLTNAILNLFTNPLLPSPPR